MLLSPLPFRDSDRVIAIQETEAGEPVIASPARLDDWSQAPGVSSVTGFYTENLTVDLTGLPERIAGLWAFGDFFATFDTAASVGCRFDARELKEAAPVVVVSDGFWRARLQASPAAIGRKLLINGTPRSIIGVLPRRAQIEDAQIYLPESASRFSRRARFL